MQQVVARTKVNPKDIGDIQIGTLLENRLLDPLNNLETSNLFIAFFWKYFSIDPATSRTNKHLNIGKGQHLEQNQFESKVFEPCPDWNSVYIC